MQWAASVADIVDTKTSATNISSTTTTIQSNGDASHAGGGGGDDNGGRAEQELAGLIAAGIPLDTQQENVDVACNGDPYDLGAAECENQDGGGDDPQLQVQDPYSTQACGPEDGEVDGVGFDTQFFEPGEETQLMQLGEDIEERYAEK
eukprot:8272369-Alexandrium_andersonii.AAC.1